MNGIVFRPENVPACLRAAKGWNIWGANGEPLKRPLVASTLANASSDDPSTWGSFDECTERAAALKCGIGVQVGSLQDQGILGIDLDGCIPDGALEPWAVEIVTRANTLTYLTPSGKGLRLFVRGTYDFKNESRDEWKHPDGKEHHGFEICRSGFQTVTGERWAATPADIASNQDFLAWLKGEFFGGGKEPTEFNGGGKSLDLVNDPRLSGDVKFFIRHGWRPEDPDFRAEADACGVRLTADDGQTRYPHKRSGCLHAVLKKLWASGVSAADQLATVLDPENRIGDALRQDPQGRKTKDPEKEARRQITRAREKLSRESAEAENGWLAKMNSKYFMIREGKTMLYYEEKMEDDEFKLFPMKWDTFFTHLQPFKEEIKVREGVMKKFPWTTLWVNHEHRRYYPYGFFLAPGVDQEGQYNLWKGFGVAPKPGKWPLLRAHIRELVGGDEKHALYVEKWLAWKFQHPADLPKVALVFIGGEGTGKNMFFDGVAKLFGVHGLVATDMDYISGRFNAHLRHKCFVFANEASTPSEENMGRFKALITDPLTSYEAKHVDRVEGHNHVGMVIVSNNDYVIRASHDARRFVAFKVSEKHKEDPAYFGPLDREIREGGLAAMLHDLLNLPLGGWHPARDRPDTPALSEQKARSLTGVWKFFHDCLVTGQLPWSSASSRPSAYVRRGEDLYHVGTAALTEFLKTWLRREDVSLNEVAEVFKTLRFEKVTTRPMGYVLPPLPGARRAWDEHSGIPWDWGPEAAWEVTAREGGHEDPM